MLHQKKRTTTFGSYGKISPDEQAKFVCAVGQLGMRRRWFIDVLSGMAATIALPSTVIVAALIALSVSTTSAFAEPAAPQADGTAALLLIEDRELSVSA